MEGKITVQRLGKGASIDTEEINTDSLLCVEFTGNNGGITVEIRNGDVVVSTTDGRLVIMPQAANAIRVKAERL